MCLGYDIRTESGYDEMMHDLEQFIGLNYLKAVHINDSRGNLVMLLNWHRVNVTFLSISLAWKIMISNDSQNFFISPKTYSPVMHAKFCNEIFSSGNYFRQLFY